MNCIELLPFATRRVGELSMFLFPRLTVDPHWPHPPYIGLPCKDQHGCGTVWYSSNGRSKEGAVVDVPNTGYLQDIVRP
jgi:hypothetical protein